jgi:opine dehydrogenase
MKKLNICIVGGGSSAHVLIPLLSSSGYNVNLLTRKPDLWNNDIELQYQNLDGDVIERFYGSISIKSSNEKEIIPNCDIIILCMPVSKYRLALNRIGKYLSKDKDIYIGTIYGGQAGFNWMVEEMKNKYKITNIVSFAYLLIPWVCRAIDYGKVGVTWGSKEINIVAVSPSKYFDYLNEVLFENISFNWFNKGRAIQSENFISLTLSGDNQLIHTSRCYGLFNKSGGKWKSLEEVPYMYKDYDDYSAGITKNLDDDYSLIRNSIKKRYPDRNFEFMLDYLSLERLTYQTNNMNILESITDSSTLGAIKPPLVKTEDYWEIDRNNRFFTDDIHYGLCIAKWIAEKMNLTVPTIDKILHWAQELRKETIIDKENNLILDSPDLKEGFNSGIPAYYGFNTIDDIID